MTGFYFWGVYFNLVYPFVLLIAVICNFIVENFRYENIRISLDALKAAGCQFINMDVAGDLVSGLVFSYRHINYIYN